MRVRLMLVAAMFAFAGAAQAADAGLDDALKKAGCSGCHASDTKKVGPAMKSVGEKYKTSDAFIAAFHKQAMHKSVKVSEADLKTVADKATGK